MASSCGVVKPHGSKPRGEAGRTGDKIAGVTEETN
jgi:hypothetical protein